MRVFIAGAGGVVGKRLLPKLAAAGHRVTAMVRSAEKARQLTSAQCTGIAVDALDRQAVYSAVAAAKPEILIHQLTALPASFDFRKIDKVFATTNRLRTEALDHFIAAGKAEGVRRFIAQSYTGWPNGRTGNLPKTEADELDSDAAPEFQPLLKAIQHLEGAVLHEGSSLNAVALRYGSFYGPGTAFAPEGPIIQSILKRRIPLVGGGEGVWSFLHIDDAADATMAAMGNVPAGIYNIVDDDPAPVKLWLPYLAQAIGAPPPRTLPVWLARFFIGRAGVDMMTSIRGSSNHKARHLLQWKPAFRSWRQGFQTGLTD